MTLRDVDHVAHAWPPVALAYSSYAAPARRGVQEAPSYKCQNCDFASQGGTAVLTHFAHGYTARDFSIAQQVAPRSPRRAQRSYSVHEHPNGHCQRDQREHASQRSVADGVQAHGGFRQVGHSLRGPDQGQRDGANDCQRRRQLPKPGHSGIPHTSRCNHCTKLRSDSIRMSSQSCIALEEP